MRPEASAPEDTVGTELSSTSAENNRSSEVTVMPGKLTPRRLASVRWRQCLCCTVTQSVLTNKRRLFVSAWFKDGLVAVKPAAGCYFNGSRTLSLNFEEPCVCTQKAQLAQLALGDLTCKYSNVWKDACSCLSGEQIFFTFFFFFFYRWQRCASVVLQINSHTKFASVCFPTFCHDCLCPWC